MTPGGGQRAEVKSEMYKFLQHNLVKACLLILKPRDGVQSLIRERSGDDLTGLLVFENSSQILVPSWMISLNARRSSGNLGTGLQK